jgi:hypothetical protein
VRGKFLYAGEDKLTLRGTTYGTFCPGPDGAEFPPPEVVAADLRAMAEQGFNTLRTYTVPPVWMLDLAREHGLRILVGIPADRHVGGQSDGTWKEAEQLVAGAVRACAGHPAVLAYSVGNELPASLIHWHGREGASAFEACVEEGHADHVFGVPLFLFRGEPFWGHDRMALLEERLAESGLSRSD